MASRIRGIVLALFFGFNAAAQVDLSKGLIVCYPFSGNAEDKSGQNNDGLVFGATLATDRFGNPNSAYEFNGNSKIVIPAAPIISKNTLTISLWIYINANVANGTAQFIYNMGDAGGFNGITVTNHYASSMYTGLGLGGFDANHVPADGSPIDMPSAQTWINTVMVVTPDSVGFYIAGKLLGMTSVGGVPPYYYNKNPGIVYLGMRTSDVQGFNGIIDDVVIYDRVLSPAEVYQLYGTGVPCKQPPTVLPPPVVNTQTRCGTGSVTISASGPGTFRWYDSNIGGKLLFEGNPFTTPSLSEAATYYVASWSDGVEGPRATVNVTVYTNAVLNCIIPATGLVGDPVLFRVNATSGTSPLTYQFDFGDGTLPVTGPDAEQTHTYTWNSNFLVTLSVEDAHGCTDSCTSVITAQPPPPIVKQETRCGAGSVILSASGTSIESFRWYNSNNGGNLLFQGNPFTTPSLSESTTFYVAAVVDDIEGPRTIVNVIVYTIPVLNCLVPATGHVGDPVLISITSTSGTNPFIYHFDFGDGVQVTGADADQNHAYTWDSDFLVTLSVEDAHGCMATCASQITTDVNIFIPNVITENGDTLNARFTVFVALGDGKFERYYGTKPFDMKIYNRWGQQVFHTNNIVQGWDGENCDAGIYYYLIFFKEDKYKGWVSLVR